jgi:hypothetical protein
MRAATTPNPANKGGWIAADPSLEGKTLSRLGSGFFSFGRTRPTESQATDWTALRDRWEYSHVARAAFAPELYSPCCFHPLWFGCGRIVPRRDL